MLSAYTCTNERQIWEFPERNFKKILNTQELNRDILFFRLIFWNFLTGMFSGAPLFAYNVVF